MFQEMPFGATKIVGFPVKEDAVGNKVKVIVPTADALVPRLQQMLMLVDHTEAETTVHCYDELRESH